MRNSLSPPLGLTEGGHCEARIVTEQDTGKSPGPVARALQVADRALDSDGAENSRGRRQGAWEEGARGRKSPEDAWEWGTYLGQASAAEWHWPPQWITLLYLRRPHGVYSTGMTWDRSWGTGDVFGLRDTRATEQRKATSHLARDSASRGGVQQSR
jgi:hypothetical protein